MNVLIALLPAIGWGLIPLIVNRVPHSQAVNQILGVGLGATLVGIIVTLIQRPAMELGVSILALISGALWSVGQVGQSFSYTRIGISKTMPLSTGLQLVGNTIIGVLIFGDYNRDVCFGGQVEPDKRSTKLKLTLGFKEKQK